MKTEKQSCCCFCFNIASEGHIVHLDILDLLKFLTVNINTSALENSTVCDGCLNSILEICEYKKRNSSKMLVETKQEIDSETSVICQKCKTVCEQGNTFPLVDCVTQIDWSDFVTYLFTDQDSQSVKSLQVCVSCRISVSNIQDLLKSIYVYDLSKIKCDVDYYDSITTGNKNSVEEKVEIKQEFENFIVNDATKVDNIMEVDKRELEDCKTELLDISYKSYADFKCKNEEVDLKLEYDYDDNQSTDRCEKVDVDKEMPSSGGSSNMHESIKEEDEQGYDVKVPNNPHFKCTYCSKKFVSKLLLDSHLFRNVKCRDSKRYECDKCSFGSTRKDVLKRHQLQHENVKGFEKHKCNYCIYETYSKCNFDRHCKTRHCNIRDFTCTLCSRQFAAKKNLENHLLKIHKCKDKVTKKTFECDKCNFVTVSRAEMLQHNVKHGIVGNLPILKCHQCTYETYNKCSLIRHMKANHIREFICNYCSRGFSYKSTLDHHLLTIHGCRSSVTSQIHKCDQCSYLTTQKSHFLRHKLQHGIKVEGYEKHKCHYCDYETYNKSNLTIHEQKHKNIPSFQCTLCSKTFTKKRYLDNHLLMIHQCKDNITNKLYECDKCSFVTVVKQKLFRHALKHGVKDNSQILKCHLCTFETYYKSCFNKHIKSKTHYKIKDFQCTLCSKHFTHKRTLNSHLKIHNNTDNVTNTI